MRFLPSVVLGLAQGQIFEETPNLRNKNRILQQTWPTMGECVDAFRNGVFGTKCTVETTEEPTEAPTTTTLRPVTEAPTGLPRVLMGYYSNWLQWRREWKFIPEDIQVQKITHINYAFAMIGSATYTEDGDATYEAGPCPFHIRHFEDNDIPQPWGAARKGKYREVNELKERYPHIKTLISVGGWSFNMPYDENPPESRESARRMKRLDSGWNEFVFSDMASTKENRTLFINSVLIFCRKWGFSGIDLDWEYPGATERGGRVEDKENFGFLLREMRAAIEKEAVDTNQEPLLFTIAAGVGPWTVDRAYDVPVLDETLDFINLMTYDLYGGWNTTHGAGIHSQLYNIGDERLSGAWAVDWWIKAGARPEKLTLGAATYSRSFTLESSEPGQGARSPVKDFGAKQPVSRTPGTAAYYEMVELIKNGATTTFDEQRCGAYLQHGDLWMGYDDENTMVCKADFVKQKGLLGAFFWELGTDDFKSNSPLISKLSAELGLPGQVTPVDVPEPSGSGQYGIKWNWVNGGFACECQEK